MYSGMADILKNGTLHNSIETVVIDDDDDFEFGFKRQDMYSEYLCGSVRPYGRHIFFCYEDWTAHVASFEPDMLYGHLARAMKERCNDFAVPTLLAICDGGHGTGLSDGDVLIFPDMINYRGLKKSNIKRFVEEVIVEGKPWSSGKQKEVTGTYVFVCAHSKNPDKRCDVCGPPVIEKFKEEIEVRALKDKVFVIPYFCSGVHRHAGHLVIYSKLENGKVSGHWYGYVVPADVADLLDQHIKKGEVIARIWRGKIGVHPLLLKGKEAVIQMQPSDNGMKVIDKENNKYGGCCYRCESWEKKKTKMYKAVIAVGAVATVFVAYHLYKWSR